MSSAVAEIDKFKGMELFADFNHEEMEKLARVCFVKKYREGQTLFVAGMPGDLMYLVLGGQLEIYRPQPGGEKHIAFVEPGEVSGEGSMVLEGTRSTHCRVTKDSEVLLLTKNFFHDLERNHPTIANKMLKYFLKTNIMRLRQGNSHLHLV